MGTGNSKKTFDGVPSGSIRRFPRLDYGAVLADLEEKRGALDQAIASIRAVMGSVSGTEDTTPQTEDNVAASVTGADIPAGAFFGKSIPEAAKLYLSVIKKKQTSAEIAEALKKYGMETQSKNFPKIVHAVLDRLRRSPNGGLVKLDRSTWGLAGWYHPSFRTVATEPKKHPKKHAKSKTVKAAKVADKSEPKAEAKSTSVPERIAQVLRSKAQTEFSSQEIATSVGIKANVASLILGQLIANKRAEKTASGKYRTMAA